MTERGKQTVVQVFASAGWGGGEPVRLRPGGKIAEGGLRRAVGIARKRSHPPENRFAGVSARAVSAPQPFRSLFHPEDEAAHRIRRGRYRPYPSVQGYLHRALCPCPFRPETEGYPYAPPGPAGRRGIFFYSYLYRRTDRIVFVSELARRVFLSSSPKIAARSVTVIHNSLPPCRRRPEVSF